MDQIGAFDMKRSYIQFIIGKSPGMFIREWSIKAYYEILVGPFQ